MYIALRGRSQYVTEYEYLIYIYKNHNPNHKLLIFHGFRGTPNISAKKNRMKYICTQFKKKTFLMSNFDIICIINFLMLLL